METLEDIISELNPSCRIGEYRDRILATSDPFAIELLKEIIDILTDVQGSYKGSIGSIQNTYMAQLEVKKIDTITVKIREYIKRLA